MRCPTASCHPICGYHILVSTVPKGKTIVLDFYDTEVEAAQAADKAYLYLHGADAIKKGRINFPQVVYSFKSY